MSEPLCPQKSAHSRLLPAHPMPQCSFPKAGKLAVGSDSYQRRPTQEPELPRKFAIVPLTPKFYSKQHHYYLARARWEACRSALA